MDLSTIYQPGKNLGSNVTLSGFLGPIIQNVSIVVGILAFITLILAGFRYVSDAGNEKNVQAAANQITYALIGLGLSILAYWITRLLFAVGGAGGIF